MMSGQDQVQRLKVSKLEVQSAIDAITELLKNLIWLKLAEYLPISAYVRTLVEQIALLRHDDIVWLTLPFPSYCLHSI